jgi:hypothetical protein
MKKTTRTELKVAGKAAGKAASTTSTMEVLADVSDLTIKKSMGHHTKAAAMQREQKTQLKTEAARAKAAAKVSSIDDQKKRAKAVAKLNGTTDIQLMTEEYLSITETEVTHYQSVCAKDVYLQLRGEIDKVQSAGEHTGRIVKAVTTIYDAKVPFPYGAGFAIELLIKTATLIRSWSGSNTKQKLDFIVSKASIKKAVTTGNLALPEITTLQQIVNLYRNFERHLGNNKIKTESTTEVLSQFGSFYVFFARDFNGEKQSKYNKYVEHITAKLQEQITIDENTAKLQEQITIDENTAKLQEQIKAAS